jgi:seryl-tRNA synthetase
LTYFSFQKWRSLKKGADDCKKEAGLLQKQIAPKLKKGENADAEKAKSKELKAQSEQMTKDAGVAEVDRDRLLRTIGNLVEDVVPVSNDEEKDSIVISQWGPDMKRDGGAYSTRTEKPVRPGADGTSGEFMSHHDVLWRIGGYDPERGVQVSGHRSYFLTNAGVMLNQSLIMYVASILPSFAPSFAPSVLPSLTYCMACSFLSRHPSFIPHPFLGTLFPWRPSFFHPFLCGALLMSFLPLLLFLPSLLTFPF